VYNFEYLREYHMNTNIKSLVNSLSINNIGTLIDTKSNKFLIFELDDSMNINCKVFEKYSDFVDNQKQIGNEVKTESMFSYIDEDLLDELDESMLQSINSKLHLVVNTLLNKVRG
jgi:hypothetical protein